MIKLSVSSLFFHSFFKENTVLFERFLSSRVCFVGTVLLKTMSN